MATQRGLPKQKLKKIEQCLNDFDARREYMKYDEYLAAGYPIGSGVVEGACRHLVKDRMERTGMRWCVDGAQPILSLRAIYLNDDWNTFHTDRIHAEQRRLYPYKERMTTVLLGPAQSMMTGRPTGARIPPENRCAGKHCQRRHQ